MPAKRFLFCILLFAVCFSACDPGIGVAIANNTSTDKHIRVLYPPEYKFPGDAPHVGGNRDSLYTYQLRVKDNYLYPSMVPRLSWDTTQRTYSFVLKPGYEAVVESRSLSGFPTFGQIFIIDDKDTVRLLRKNDDFKKTPKLLLGGTWRHKIQQ